MFSQKSENSSVVYLLDFSHLPGTMTMSSGDSINPDSSLPIEYNLYVRNVCSAVKVTINKLVSRMMASSQKTNVINLCLVSMENNGIEIALPLQRVSIVEGHGAVNRIEQRILSAENQGLNLRQRQQKVNTDTLHLGLGLVVNMFKNQELNGEMKVICLTHSWSQSTSSCSTQVDMLLKVRHTRWTVLALS